MDTGNSTSPDTSLNQVTSCSLEKMKNRKKQKNTNQPKKLKVFKNAKKFKLAKQQMKLNNELNKNELINKIKLNLPDKLNENSVKEIVSVAANLLLKSIASQTTHKAKCNLLANLLTNKQIKLSKDKLGDKFNLNPNSLTINHQPLIAMFGQNNEKIEETISCVKEADKFNDKFKNNDKCNFEQHRNCKDDHNCLNSNETHQIVISLLERLIDQQQNAIMQLNQLQNKKPNKSKKRNNDRRKKLKKIKEDLNGLKMVKLFLLFLI